MTKHGKRADGTRASSIEINRARGYNVKAPHPAAKTDETKIYKSKEYIKESDSASSELSRDPITAQTTVGFEHEAGCSERSANDMIICK